MAMHDYKKTDGGPIDSATAKKWMERYKNKHGKEAIRAYFFGTDIIEKILGNPEAVGLRIYLGNNESDNDKLQMVLIGVRKDGTNIWPEENLAKDGGDGGTIGDGGVPCPPNCAGSDD